MRFFGLKSCDTCRKALKTLADRNVDVIDVRADGVLATDRAAIIAAFSDAAINTRSTTWRNLSDDERALGTAALLAAHPTLMKRPVIEIDGAWAQGWTPATKAALGLEK
jgi:arsenate reductase-like glutaredoxin family protein